ncbi:MAG: hypothetical protein COA55_11735 [Alcanivorax sp.]|nr:MAG: hypothetical protein COA55_11735 [Alcanivorax sp.]
MARHADHGKRVALVRVLQADCLILQLLVVFRVVGPEALLGLYQSGVRGSSRWGAQIVGFDDEAVVKSGWRIWLRRAGRQGQLY